MTLVEYELNRAIVFGEIGATGRQLLFGSNLVRAVVERYGFIEAPKTAEEFSPQRGVAFRHGYFHSQIIERFQFYNNGMFAEARADTDLSEEFLADVIEWAQKEAGLVFNEGGGGRIYMSQIVVESSAIALGTALSALQAIQERILSLLSASSAPHLPSQVSGFHIQSDPAVGAGWTYRLERRAGQSFGANLYFSSAPLRTRDHLALIEKMETELT